MFQKNRFNGYRKIGRGRTGGRVGRVGRVGVLKVSWLIGRVGLVGWVGGLYIIGIFQHSCKAHLSENVAS